MSSIKRCPHCKLVNPENGLRCDCGYDFDSNELKASLMNDKERRVSSTARLIAFVTDSVLIQIPFFLFLRAHTGSHQAVEYGISLGLTSGDASPNVLPVKLSIPIFGYAAFWYPSLWMLPVAFAYYFLFEYFLQRTPGKFLVRSHVEGMHQSRPTARDVVIRTLVRFVPLEPFSGFQSSGQC
jgi:hypothetical protein